MSVVRFRPEAPKQNPKLFGLGFCFFCGRPSSARLPLAERKAVRHICFFFLAVLRSRWPLGPAYPVPTHREKDGSCQGRRAAARIAGGGKPPKAHASRRPGLVSRPLPAPVFRRPPPRLASSRSEAGFLPPRARRGRAAAPLEAGAARSVFRISLVCDRGFKIRNFQKARFRRMSILRGALFAVLSVDRSPYIFW